MLNKPGVLLFLLKTFTILLLVASSACQLLNKQVPISMESAISPADVYASIEDRNLIIKYHNNLENIYDNVRDRYKVSQLEFFMISGICFRELQIKKTFATYLALNTKIYELFLNNKTDYEQRLSIVFNHYLKPLLKIAAEEKEILRDVNIVGIMISSQWKVKNPLKEEYYIIVDEQVSLVTPKEQIGKYLRDKITDQELLDQSTLIVINEDDPPRIIKLILK
ncbi:MAG: hypothetical protein JRE20_02735 [Deltaproteobacteria bacterium]|jgi:hypothetical protein|nr:hypothetical protein [Deltaproteobacteria bacterium]